MPNATANLSRAPGRSRFLAGVVGIAAAPSMDADVIEGVAMITRGEARGHGFWCDGDFCDQVAAATNAGRPIKSRWTHPGLSSDGMGKLVGHLASAYRDGDTVRARLKVADLAHRSPDGDLGAYVLEQARTHPEDFGLSIVFDHDRDGEISFLLEHGAELKDDDGWQYVDLTNFRSPDPDNVDNLPHCRLKRLSACDFVGDPAANPGGLFSAGQSELPAAAEAFVAYALRITDEPPPGPFQGVDPERARAFAGRFFQRFGVNVTRANPKERTQPTMPQGTPRKGLLARVFGTGKPSTSPAKLGSKTKPAAPAAKLQAKPGSAKPAKLGEGKDDEDLEDDEEPVANDDRPKEEPAKEEEEQAEGDDEPAAGVQTSCPECGHEFICDAETGEASAMGDDERDPDRPEYKPGEEMDDDEAPKSADLGAYLQTFGATAGAQLFARGLGFKKAARERIAGLQKQLSDARKEVARLQAIAANAGEGEAAGVSFGGEAKPKALSNVPANVARFATACTPKK